MEDNISNLRVFLKILPYISVIAFLGGISGICAGFYSGSNFVMLLSSGLISSALLYSSLVKNNQMLLIFSIVFATMPFRGLSTLNMNSWFLSHISWGPGVAIVFFIMTLPALILRKRIIQLREQKVEFLG